MNFYEMAQNKVRTALKMLHRVLTDDNNEHLWNHPIKMYLDENTVQISETGDTLKFDVGPYSFVVEPEYILFQGALNDTEPYLKTYELITQTTRLSVPGQTRICQLNDVKILIHSTKYSLPNLTYDEKKPWIVTYFDQIVEYIRNAAGAPKYEVIQEESVSTLSDEVWIRIQEGWQPVGGVSAVYAKLGKHDAPDDNGEARLIYLQAMVK